MSTRRVPDPSVSSYARDFERVVNRYSDRHRVSGLTGWHSDGLRGRTSIADRVEWDNYIQNWSLRLDLRILAADGRGSAAVSG